MLLPASLRSLLKPAVSSCSFGRIFGAASLGLLLLVPPVFGSVSAEDDGMSAAGSYFISPGNQSITIHWRSTGYCESRVDVANSFYDVAIGNASWGQGYSNPTPLTTKEGSFTWPVNFGQSVQITEHAQCDTDVRRAYEDQTFTYQLTGDQAISNTGDVGDAFKKTLQNIIGEPVDVSSGAYYEDHVDLHVNGPLPIEVRRTYSSLNTRPMNEFGYGWLFNYSSYLIRATDGSTLQAADADGSVIIFRLVPGFTAKWVPMAADNPTLTNTGNGGTNPFNSVIVQTGTGLGSTYQWTTGDGSVRTYTEQKFPVTLNGVPYDRQRPYLTSWQDNRGNTLTFNYGTSSSANDYGRIKNVQSSNGTYVNFMYDTEGHILTATASDGRQVQYTYDPTSFDLLTVQLPSGGGTYQYQYGTYSDGTPDHLLIQKTSPSGRILQNFYDGGGRVIQQKTSVDQNDPANPSALEITASYDYNTYANAVVVTDANNHSTGYKSVNGQMLLINDAKGQIMRQAWYTSTNSSTGAYINSLQTVTDKRGLVTTYLYDNTTGAIKETDVTGDLTGDGSIKTATTTAQYDSTLNLPTTVTDASGIITTYTYGGDGHSNHKYLPTQIVTTAPDGTTILRTEVLTYIDKTDSTVTPAIFANGLLSSRTVYSGDIATATDKTVTSYAYDPIVIGSQHLVGFMTQKTVQTNTSTSNTSNDSDPAVVTNYSYTSAGELLTVTDGDQRTTTYAYDGMSRPLTKTVAETSTNTLGVWNMTYTPEGDLSETDGPHTNPANTVTRTYDLGGRLSEVDVQVNQAQSNGSGVTSAGLLTAKTFYGYDFAGNLTTETDPLGNVTTMTYDADNELTGKSTYQGTATGILLRSESWTYEPGGKVATYTDPRGGVTYYSYTQAGQLSKQQNPDHSVLKWRYQTDGRLSTETRSDGTSDFTTSTTTYDDAHYTVTRTLKNAGSTTLATETSIYDCRGNLISHTDVDGYTTTTTYDGLNRPRLVVGPPATSSSAQRATAYIYTASDKTVGVENGVGDIAITISDALNRPVATGVIDHTTGTVIRLSTFSYSADNNSVLTVNGTPSGSPSQTARRVYTDTLDRPVLTVNGDLTFTLNAYDLAGNLSSSTDAIGHTTNYGYNALHQLTSQTLPDNAVIHFTYNGAGDLLTRVMPDGSLTQTQAFNAFGQKTSETLASGSLSTRNYTYSYFTSGEDIGLLQTATLTDSSGNHLRTATRGYDDFLRTTTITTADATAGTLPQYNSATTYGYDNRGNLLTVDQSSTANAAGPHTLVTRSYDGNSQLLTDTVTLPDSSVTLASVTQTWDAAGRRVSLNEGSSSISNSSSPLFVYTYRGDGLLTKVAAPGNTGSGLATLNYSYAYGDNGLLNSRTSPFRTLTIDTRDGVGRITHETNSINGNPVMIDAMGWRGNSTLNLYQVLRTDSWNESRSYFYNSRDQLTSENFSPTSGTESTLNYAFDGNNPGLGVRTDAKVGTGAPGSWERTAAEDALGRVNPDDQLAGTTPTGNVANSYDAEGNVILRSWTGGAQGLFWDAQGRLIKVSQRDGSNNGYDWVAVYDGLGRRVMTANQPIVNNAASGSATFVNSIYDPQVEFLEIGVSVNGAKAWKVYGPDMNERLGGMQGTGGLEATVFDSGGTATGILNDGFGNGLATITGAGSSATLSWNAAHVGAYGPLPGFTAQPLTNISQLASAVAWRGHYIDPTGFYGIWDRPYDPVSGRWLSCDPMGFAAGLSLYGYCNGDPLNNFDPDGRCAVDYQGSAHDSDWWANYIATGQLNWGGGSSIDFPASYGQNSADPNWWPLGVGSITTSPALNWQEYFPTNESPSAWRTVFGDALEGVGDFIGDMAAPVAIFVATPSKAGGRGDVLDPEIFTPAPFPLPTRIDSTGTSPYLHDWANGQVGEPLYEMPANWPGQGMTGIANDHAVPQALDPNNPVIHSPENQRPMPSAMNSVDKAPFDAELAQRYNDLVRSLQRYENLPESDAKAKAWQAMSEEINGHANSVPARPMDPAQLDQLPSK